MADLAERVDDLICSFDSAGETTMDTLSMLIFGWMLFGLVVLCVGKYVYNRFVLNELATTSSAQLAKDSHVHHGESGVLAGTAVGKLFDRSKSTSPSSTSSSSLVRAGGASGAGGTISASGGTATAASGSASGGGGGSGGGVGTGAVAGVRSPSPGGYVQIGRAHV